MQGQAAALRGRGDDLSVAIASLDPFAEQTDRLLRLLDSQEVALRALRPRRRRDLRRPLRAPRPAARADRELRRGVRDHRRAQPGARGDLHDLPDLPAGIAGDADPARAVRRSTPTRSCSALQPAARELEPTLIEVQRLAPELNSLLRRPAAGDPTSAPKGLRGDPASCSTDDLPPLLEGFDPWLARLQLDPRGASACTSTRSRRCSATSPRPANGVFFDPTLGKSFHYLRTEAPLAPEAISTYPSGCRSRAPTRTSSRGVQRAPQRPEVVRGPAVQLRASTPSSIPPVADEPGLQRAHRRRRGARRRRSSTASSCSPSTTS